jgi:TatD DNase family protein
MYVDSHAHLDFEQYRADLDDVLERAAKAGVTEILTVGCVGAEPGVIERVAELIRDRDNLYAAFGAHPHDARHFTAELEQTLADLMRDPRVVGWGEIGLDFHYDHSPRDQQLGAFRRQLRRAFELGKPVIIHSREADRETCRILSEEPLLPAPGALHCFTSDRTTAERCLALGFYISFGGILSFKTAGTLRAIARDIPEDRLLIETDSPYLAPEPYRGRRNEPAYVVRVAEVLAEIRGTTAQVIAQQTSRNFRRLFRIQRP